MTLPDSRGVPPDHPAAERERGFDALFRQHYQALRRFAVRILGGVAEAEDVVQEVFLFVWERTDVIDEATPSRAYLYRAVHNAALNRIRHRRVEDRWAEGEGKHQADAVPAPAEAALVEEELAGAVRRAVEQLPERTRLVYTLSRQDQLTYAEIAATLGISVKTVETQMTRAFRRLRIVLGPFLMAVMLVLRQP